VGSAAHREELLFSLAATPNADKSAIAAALISHLAMRNPA